MSNLNIIKNFDEYYSLNEGISLWGDRNQRIINNAFRNLGVITFKNGQTVTPDEIIEAINEAIHYLKMECPSTFYFAEETMKIIYLAHSSKYETMAVDSHMNLYINAGFVYNHLKMDKQLIAAVLMHEVFHIVYDHIARSKNWLSAKGKPINKANWHDTNLAADVEVNQSVVKSNILTADRLVNEIRGIYLKNTNGSSSVSVVPLETILNNEEYMNILRQMDPPPIDPEDGPTIETSDEWDSGYKELWNKLVPLIKRYGWKDIWQKLQDAKLINGVGEVEDIKVDDIKKTLDELDFDPSTMNYLLVKSFDEFINEDNNPISTNGDTQGKTYEDGYMTSFTALVNTIKGVIEGNQGGDGGGGGQQGPKIKSKLNDEDLEELELPEQPDNGGDGDDEEESEGGLPQNIKQKQKGSKKGKSKPKSNSGSSDDDNEGEEPDNEKDVKSAGKMIDDLRKKMEKQEQGGDDSQDGGYGPDGVPEDENDGDSNSSGKSMGGSNSGEGRQGGKQPQGGSESGGNGIDSFTPDDNEFDNSVLKESGYSDEDIEEINKVRKLNARENSPERLRKVLDDYRNQLKTTDYVNKVLGVIEVESKKYKNIWEEILRKFLYSKTRRAGRDINTGSNDWKKKKQISLGSYGIHRQKQAQDPQDVNLYVDVSGSMDEELLEIIAKSLVILAERNAYSGLNVCPWASTNEVGCIKIESLYESTKDKVVADIMGAISLGVEKCGGGTLSSAVLTAFLNCVEQNLKDPRKVAKDDVHIVITDGQISGIDGIENDIENALLKTFNKNSIATKAPKNTFWMIYDASEHLRKEWENEIKKGTLIFIDSQMVKNSNKVKKS